MPNLVCRVHASTDSATAHSPSSGSVACSAPERVHAGTAVSSPSGSQFVGGLLPARGGHAEVEIQRIADRRHLERSEGRHRSRPRTPSANGRTRSWRLRTRPSRMSSTESYRAVCEATARRGAGARASAAGTTGLSRGEALADGILTIIDEGNREGLEIAMGVSLPSRRVMRVLNELVALHGPPSSGARRQRARSLRRSPSSISVPNAAWPRTTFNPGSRDVYVERFNRSYRTEVLYTHLFESIAELKALTNACSGFTTASDPTTASAGCRPHVSAEAIV